MDARRQQGQALLDALADDLGDLPGVDRKAMFGSRAVRVDGKIAAFVGTDGELIVKLPADRVDAEVAAGAERVRIGRNDAREWVGVPQQAKDRWPLLVDEAMAHVRPVT